MLLEKEGIPLPKQLGKKYKWLERRKNKGVFSSFEHFRRGIRRRVNHTQIRTTKKMNDSEILRSRLEVSVNIARSIVSSWLPPETDDERRQQEQQQQLQKQKQEQQQSQDQKKKKNGSADVAAIAESPFGRPMRYAIIYRYIKIAYPD